MNSASHGLSSFGKGVLSSLDQVLLHYVVCIGSGNDTSFWLDRWCRNFPLKDEFLALYDLAFNKFGTVADMGRMVDGVWN